MSVFVDTSGLYALLDRDDANHAAARTMWGELVEGDVPMFTTNYVLVELLALVQRRLGTEALRAVAGDALPLVAVEWISELDHAAALAALLAADRRELSFVDLSSFQVLRRLGVREVFAFDRHFGEQGFQGRR